MMLEINEYINENNESHSVVVSNDNTYHSRVYISHSTVTTATIDSAPFSTVANGP